jgi:hypothetical protein
MAAGNVTSVSHSVYRPDLWRAKTLDYLKEKLVVANTIDRSADSQVKQKGKTVNVITFGNSGAARLKTDDGLENVVFDTQTETIIPVNMNKQAYKGHNITNLVDVQSEYELFNKYTADVAFQLKRQIDVDCVTAIITSIVAGGVAQTIGTTGSGVLNDVLLSDAVAILQTNNVDFESEGVTLLVNPKGASLIRLQTKFSSVDFIQKDNGTPTVTGMLPMQIFGAKVVYSNLVPAGVALMYHSEVATLALQQDVSYMQLENPRSLATELVGSVIYGDATLRSNVGVRIQY